MTALKWDEAGKHFYETGTSMGTVKVLKDSSVVEAWDGLIGVAANPSGADETKIFANNKKYLGIRAAEEFGGTITAYTAPDSFIEADGGRTPKKGVTIHQQARLPFHLTWQTIKGNDSKMNDYGYIIHIAYNATVSPSQRDYKTVNESPETMELSWEFSCTPVNVPGSKPTAYITLDSTTMGPNSLEAVTKKLYGDESSQPDIPLPEALFALITD